MLSGGRREDFRYKPGVQGSKGGQSGSRSILPGGATVDLGTTVEDGRVMYDGLDGAVQCCTGVVHGAQT